MVVGFYERADPVPDAGRGASSPVEDPELGLDIVSLGLVSAVERDGDDVRVVHATEKMSDDAKFLLGVYG